MSQPVPIFNILLISLLYFLAADFTFRGYPNLIRCLKTSNVGCKIVERFIADQKFSDNTKNLILQSWRKSTTTSYQSAWNKWEIFCSQRATDPLHTSLVHLLDFFTESFERGLQFNTLCRYRSAILSIVHVEGIPEVSSNPLLKRLFRGIFNARPPQPRYTHTWDINLVFNHMRALGPNRYLPFMILSQKVAILLSLLSGKRVHSLSLLQKSNMSKYPSDKPSVFTFHIPACEKHSRPSFSGKPLKFRSFSEQARCPVEAILQYLSWRDSLSDSDQFFISTG